MSNIYNNRLTGFQNNSKDVLARIYDSSGNLYNLGGYDAFFYAQKYPPKINQPLDVSISATGIDPSNGSILFSLDSSTLSLDAGDYVYEIIIDNGAGIVISVVQDRLQMINSIKY